MATDWDGRLEAWRDELDLLARLDDAHWVPLAVAEAETGVSRSALRSWYRNREIPSRLVDGPNGPQRLVPLTAVIELLGWPQSGASYQRIEEALHRWVGVVLMYENAWWDNAAKSWVDENFHVLDNVTLYDRERRRPAARAGKSPRLQRRAEREIGVEAQMVLLQRRVDQLELRLAALEGHSHG